MRGGNGHANPKGRSNAKDRSDVKFWSAASARSAWNTRGENFAAAMVSQGPDPPLGPTPRQGRNGPGTNKETSIASDPVNAERTASRRNSRPRIRAIVRARRPTASNRQRAAKNLRGRRKARRGRWNKERWPVLPGRDARKTACHKGRNVPALGTNPAAKRAGARLGAWASSPLRPCPKVRMRRRLAPPPSRI